MTMAKSVLPPESWLAALPTELSHHLFAKARPLSLAVIRQKVSQSDLAAMAGIARENVSRVVNDWANRSLVSRLAGYYCINKAALNREAEG